MIENKVQNARQELLAEASHIVSQDRNTSYGNPEDNFRDISDLQSAYMRGKTDLINPMDVAMLNILQKIARLKFNPLHRDSLVDIAGYAACAAEIQSNMIVRTPVLHPAEAALKQTRWDKS